MVAEVSRRSVAIALRDGSRSRHLPRRNGVCEIIPKIFFND